MTDLTTVPDASPLLSTDKILIMRSGGVFTITFAELLTQVQVEVSAIGPVLLGRIAGTAGGPQTVALGSGVAIGGGALNANGDDHTGLALLGEIDLQAELVVNSGAAPARLPLPLLLNALLSSVVWSSLPTAPDGLPSGALYWNGGVLCRVV